MTRFLSTTLCIAAAVAAAGCSTKPRQFSAQVRPVAQAPERASLASSETEIYQSCDQMVRHGRKAGFAAAAATSGAGVAGMFGGANLAFTGLGGSTFASAGATAAAAMPIIGLAAAFGMNRAIRGGRERSYRKHMTTCMGEMGYEVADWTRAPKKQRGTASLVPASERVAQPADIESARIEEPATQTDPAASETPLVVVLDAPAG
ncbi:hypothetical protein N0B51_03215 [Tsuneonella sp. YG55]|uniref:Lipoprotein n=1 Tax=Tsuneonella litorea TaxID=2976475 RepID=A0A9X2VZZ4_9SPHN|nr:hypothetical protein [Tsuneonella litorea]MCT2557984.1 hypothetical protein [Tsuneonella litorea]